VILRGKGILFGVFEMGNLYILMGRERTRKSVTIRALTGFTRCNPLEVKLENGDTKTIYVIASSAQEDARGFRNKVVRINQEGHEWDILLALHPDNKASDFIRQIPEVNRQEIHIVPLGSEGIHTDLQRDISNLPSSRLTTYTGIPASRTMPANEIAHQIRAEWDWL